MPDFWLNPTAKNYVGTVNAAEWKNLSKQGLVIGIYVAIRTDVAGETYHRYQRLPIIVDDGFGALFYNDLTLFTFDVTSGGNYLVGYSGIQFTHGFELGTTNKIALNGYFSGLYNSTNMIVQSGDTIDGTFFNMGTALRMRIK